MTAVFTFLAGVAAGVIATIIAAIYLDVTAEG
jgi:energy-converting hydrogenase Eha subunit C